MFAIKGKKLMSTENQKFDDDQMFIEMVWKNQNEFPRSESFDKDLSWKVYNVCFRSQWDRSYYESSLLAQTFEGGPIGESVFVRALETFKQLNCDRRHKPGNGFVRIVMLEYRKSSLNDIAYAIRAAGKGKTTGPFIEAVDNYEKAEIERIKHVFLLASRMGWNSVAEFSLQDSRSDGTW